MPCVLLQNAVFGLLVCNGSGSRARVRPRPRREMMADVRAEIEATRRVTRDRTRQLAMLDAATRRMQDVQDRVVLQGAVELESAPASDATAATVQLPPPPPSPIQNTHAPTQQLAVLTLAAPGAAPDSDTTDDVGDRQPRRWMPSWHAPRSRLLKTARV